MTEDGPCSGNVPSHRPYRRTHKRFILMPDLNPGLPLTVASHPP